MKLERLAGIPGKPEVEAGYGGDWYVCQYSPGLQGGQVYGPVRKDERAAPEAAMTFNDIWPTLPIPAEYDGMDETDQLRWRLALRTAYDWGYEEGAIQARKSLVEGGE